MRLNTFLRIVLHAVARAFGFFTLLVEFSLEIMQYLLEHLHISHTELVHVLRQMRLLIFNLVLELDDFELRPIHLQ